MTIQFGKPPEESIQALGNWAEKLKIRPTASVPAAGPKLSAARGGNLSHPHKIYFLGLRDVARGAGIRKAKLVGWRYLVKRKGHTHAVDVSVDRLGNHRFSHLSHGRFPAETLSALKATLAGKHAKAGEYLLGVLEVPSLHVIALRLEDRKDHDKDILIPLPPTHHLLGPGRPYPAQQMLEVLRAAASEKVKMERQLGLRRAGVGEWVWASPASKVYRRAADPWCGRTRHGKYMTERECKRAGYHEARRTGGARR